MIKRERPGSRANSWRKQRDDSRRRERATTRDRVRPLKDHLLGLVIDGALSPDDKEEAARIARDFLEGTGG